jgi:hypothetical protein
MSNFKEVPRRMTPRREAVVAVDGVSSPAWLRVADVVISEHRTRRQARRWIADVYRRYPDCLLAVARQRRGRWCLVGLPARNILMCGRFDLADAEQLGRMVYHLWVDRYAQL